MPANLPGDLCIPFCGDLNENLPLGSAIWTPGLQLVAMTGEVMEKYSLAGGSTCWGQSIAQPHFQLSFSALKIGYVLFLILLSLLPLATMPSCPVELAALIPLELQSKIK